MKQCGILWVSVGALWAALLPLLALAGSPDTESCVRLRNAVVDTSSAAQQAQGGVLNAQGKISADSKSIFAQYGDADRRLPFIIQFIGPVQQAWKQAVEQTGARLGGYLPDNAFIVEMTSNQLGQVAALESVRWVGPFKPDYKTDSALSRRVAGARNTFGPVAISDETFTIQTFSFETVSVVRDAVLKGNGRVLSVASSGRRGLLRVRMSVASVSELLGLPEIEFIEVYVAPQLYNNVATDSEYMNVQSLWTNSNLTGAGQIVCVADTGLDSGNTNAIHPDFSNRVVAAFALGRPDDWSDSSLNPIKKGGHGTHVSGSVLGSGAAWSNGLFRGAAYEAALVIQSIMDTNGTLGGIPDALTNLFSQAYTSGARLHNNSWGSAVAGQYDSASQSADQFMWDVKDMLLLFAAGNDGTDARSRGVIDPTSLGSPATAKNVLTVGASESKRPSGSGGYSAYTYFNAWPGDYSADPIKGDLISTAFDTYQGMAAFSSRGPCVDGRFKPDIVAPGTDIISCRSRMPGAGVEWGTGSGVLDNTASNYYTFSGGTSMSTPLTTGAATLMRQYLCEYRGFAAPSAALMKAILVNGARSLSPGQYGVGQYREIPATRPNNVEGWGQVDLANTLFPPLSGTNVYYDMTSSSDALVTGGSRTYSFIVSSTNMINITLCWSDYPATLSAAKQLVNDLDLIVITPDGVTHYPNNLTSADRLNNTEGVDVSCASTGAIQIIVSGYNVPNAPQPYALVIRGAGTAVPPSPSSSVLTALSADFDGDRLADPAVYNTNGTWKIKLSGGGYALLPLTGFLGGSGYTALAADFDGDAKADPAIYSADLELWAVKLSSINYLAPTVLTSFGGSGWQAITGDFDGDRLADPALYNTNGTWKVKLSTAGYQTITSVGLLGFADWTAIAADFDGDGKVDPAIYKASTGSWIVMLSKVNYALAVLETGFLGSTGYIGMAADFDGDRLADPTVAQTSTGNWKIKLSGGNYSLLELNGFLSGE